MRNLRYYGLSKSEYVSCTDIIRSFNEKRMGFTADMGVLFLGGLLILSFVLPAIRLFRYAYGITAFVCACISFSALNFLPCKTLQADFSLSRR